MEQELILLLIACILIYIYTQQTQAEQKKLEQVEHLTGNCKYPLLSNGVCWNTWEQLFKK